MNSKGDDTQTGKQAVVIDTLVSDQGTYISHSNNSCGIYLRLS